MWQGEHRAIFATTPVVLEGWEEVPLDQLQVYRSGELIWQGKVHGHEFHEEDYDMTPLMSAFSEL